MRMLGLRRKVPVYLQNEATECGLCSVAMIADYHGYSTDLPSLRLRFAISRKGANLASLMKIAQALKFETRALKLGMGSLRKLQLPCIVHWDMDHFVVLVSVNARHAVIHDPAIGRRTLPLDEFSKYFTGVALEMKPANDFTPQAEKLQYTLAGLMGRITGLKRALIQVFALAIALECVVIALPFFMQWVVDHALVSGDRDLLTVLALGFGLLVLVQGAISAVRSWTLMSLSTEVNFQWYGNVFGHLLKLPLEFFEKRHVGNIISRFSSVSTIQKTLTNSFIQTIVDGIMVVGTLAMMLLYSGKLAAIALTAVVLYAGLRCVLYFELRDAAAEQIVFSAKQSTHFYETANGIQSIRLFDKGEQRRGSWMNILADQFNAELRILRVRVNYETAQTVVFGLERVLVVWLAARSVLDGAFTAGMLFAFISYKDQFSTRVAALTDRLLEFKMLGLHAERVADIVMAAPEQESHADFAETPLPTVAPRIELRNVSYRYAPGEPFIFENVSLTVEEGECVAITGVSGCGKTTLVKILLGLLEPEQGEVLMNDVPIKHIGLSAYRRQIGTVMQEDRLFSGSIAENISFFDVLPDWDRIREAASQAAIAHEVERMPMGYNTITGSNGIGISGGQQQRILLARALYRQPQLLVLDEATSELDVSNERAVNATVKQLGLTRIIVAHRPETIAMAERVVILRNGKLFDTAVENKAVLHAAP